MARRVTRRDVGRSITFEGYNGYGQIVGQVRTVRRGVVTVAYYLWGPDYVFTAYFPVDSPRLLGMGDPVPGPVEAAGRQYLASDGA